MVWSVHSYIFWSAAYGMLLGAALALAVTVTLWFYVLAAIFAWRLLWNMRRLARWVKDCSDALGQP